ncbi:MAG: NAD-dependent epimerase/dehydratase family protein [Crocinitomicaceae bacterium]|nr:NAD-dependent epimerase/dehydratase family protein [Crocinitomicaceae bacterium]
MKVLVTGPDGVLGSNLVRELLSREYEVSVMLLEGAKSPTLDGLNITRFYGNILNPDTLSEPFKDKDVIIHCAANTSVYPSRNEFVNRVNIEGSQNVIDKVLEYNIKQLIYVGTANSFGYGSMDAPGIEGNPYASEHYGLDYMDSKQKTQELVLKSVKEDGLPAIVVNPTFMIGPYDSTPSSGAMIMAVHNGKVVACPPGGKNFIAVKDAAIGIANAITMGEIGECYIIGNVNMTYKEAFVMIATTIGAKPPKMKFGSFMVKFYGSMSSFFASVFRYTPTLTRQMADVSCDEHYYSPEKARRELALPQTPIEDAVKECYKWFGENGLLDKK